jgi:hypothetical protein
MSNTCSQNTKTKGELTELRVLCKLQEMGFSTSLPWGDNQRYDCIVDVNNILLRIQIKSSRFRNGAVVFQTSSSYRHTKSNVSIKGYDFNEIDAFITFSEEQNEFYACHVFDSPKVSIRLRVKSAKNNNSKNVRMAKNYILSKDFLNVQILEKIAMRINH